MSSLWHRFMLKYRKELRSPHMSRTLLELLLKEMNEQVSSLETSVTTLEGDVDALEALAALREEIVMARDQKATNLPGGTFTSGAWRTRDLNQLAEGGAIPGVSLVANQLTLPAGTWEIWGSAPAGNGVGRHQTKLEDVTNPGAPLTLAVGTAEAQSNSTCTRSFFYVVVTFTESTVFEIQHRCTTTVANSGFGLAAMFGPVEVYSYLVARRLV